MAKRRSKKATSPQIQKEEPAIKNSISSTDKSAETEKEKTRKPRAKKGKPTEAKKEAPVVKRTETKKDKEATKSARAVSRKAVPVAAAKVEAEEIKKKPLPKTAASGKENKEKVNRPAVRKPSSVNTARPVLRSVYSNSKYTLLVLGFGSDFQTKKSMVIFSDLLSGQVYTIALSVWNRWKLREVKKINTET